MVVVPVSSLIRTCPFSAYASPCELPFAYAKLPNTYVFPPILPPLMVTLPFIALASALLSPHSLVKAWLPIIPLKVLLGQSEKFTSLFPDIVILPPSATVLSLSDRAKLPLIP